MIKIDTTVSKGDGKMIFDNEQDILDWTSSLYGDNVLLFNGNSFEKKILKYLKDKSSLISDNGHDAFPPDYYSDIHSFMFDVMRVNDTEVNKKHNPVKERERKLEKELRESGILDKVSPDCKVFCMSETSDVSEHNYEAYRKNVNRVMQNHIDKIPIWTARHPDIKYKGLFIFDETECYFEGIITHAFDDKFLRGWQENNLVLHEPWNDENFISKAYDSDLDFLVLVYPWKYLGFPRVVGEQYPPIVIMDVRFPRTRPYKAYDTEMLVC